MDVKIRAITLLLSLLELLVSVQTLEDSNAEYQNVLKEACDSMLVSHVGSTDGKARFLCL